MPKDEFDFEDPLELSGVVVPSDEDTTEPMCQCFIEEYLRLGYDHRQILQLFRNPYYIGLHLALRERGEAFIRRLIAEQFACWGKEVSFESTVEDAPANPAEAPPAEVRPVAIDPMGLPAPEFRI